MDDFPLAILELRKRITQVLYAVITEAWIRGVSTRKASALRSAFTQPSIAGAEEQQDRVVVTLAGKFPKAAVIACQERCCWSRTNMGNRTAGA